MVDMKLDFDKASRTKLCKVNAKVTLIEEAWQEFFNPHRDKVYEDYDWDELPEDIMQETEILGYSKSLWDNDKDPPLLSSHEWEDLSSKQLDAAILFGYSKKDFKLIV